MIETFAWTFPSIASKRPDRDNWLLSTCYWHHFAASLHLHSLKTWWWKVLKVRHCQQRRLDGRNYWKYWGWTSTWYWHQTLLTFETSLQSTVMKKVKLNVSWTSDLVLSWRLFAAWDQRFSHPLGVTFPSVGKIKFILREGFKA